MDIEEILYTLLKEDESLNEIFNGNIHPISGKKNKLPVLLYQLFQIDSEQSKTKGELKGEYILKLHVFSEKYTDVIDSIKKLKELLDFKLIEDNGITVIDLIRFNSFTDEYNESSELYNRTLNYSIFIY